MERRLAIALSVATLLALAVTTGTAAQTISGRNSAPAETSYNLHGTFLLDGRRFFPLILSMPPPLGSVTPWGSDALDELVAAGVTVFRTGPVSEPWTQEHLETARAWNEAAAARGVHTWAYLRELAEAEPDSAAEAMLRQVVTELTNSPGLGMWKGADEPWPDLEPSDLAHAYGLVKQTAPHHVFHTIFAPRNQDGRARLVVPVPDPPDLRGYNAVTDTHGVDVYPVYFSNLGVREHNLHTVGLWTQALQRATERNAITTTLQICFAGSDDPSGSGAFVLPTRRQERYMIYDAIINGARGLIFYGGHLRHCHNALDAAHGWNWTFWTRVLGSLVREIGVGSPLYAPLLRPETTSWLATNRRRTQAISRRAGNGFWVLAAHGGRAAATVTIRGLPKWARIAYRYPGGRAILARDGRIRDRFTPWGVRVYRFTR